MKITENSTVTIDYTITLDTGEVVDSTRDTDPLTYTQGEGELMPGVEKRMDGLKKGDTLEVVLSPAEGFGDPDPEARIEIPKTDIPPEALRVDALLQGKGPQGQSIEGRVIELKENTALVDFNHPLAGKNLHFTVTVVDVK